MDGTVVSGGVSVELERRREKIRAAGKEGKTLKHNREGGNALSEWRA